MAEALKVNNTLTSVKYAAARPFPYRQGPLTIRFDSFCSLRENKLGAEGAKYISEGLTINETLTSLEYATSHCSLRCC